MKSIIHSSGMFRKVTIFDSIDASETKIEDAPLSPKDTVNFRNVIFQSVIAPILFLVAIGVILVFQIGNLLKLDRQVNSIDNLILATDEIKSATKDDFIRIIDSGHSITNRRQVQVNTTNVSDYYNPFLLVDLQREYLLWNSTVELYESGKTDVTHLREQMLRVVQTSESIIDKLRFERPAKIKSAHKVIHDSFYFGSIILLVLGAALGLHAKRMLEKLASAYEASIRIRDDFVSMASHELKTPISATKLRIQAILRKFYNGDFDKEMAIEQLTKAQTALDKLTSLVSDLLHASKLSAGVSYKKETFDVSLLVFEVVDRFSEYFAAKRQRPIIHIQPELQINSDKMKIEQILTNLLTNAVKYGGSNEVGISLEKVDEDIVLKVSDMGEGIDPKDHQNIFTRFTRVSESKDGFGLGLWIVQRIVNQLGGKIYLKSALGKGSIFTVFIPVGELK